MPALSGAKGKDDSNVHSEGHKSARVKKKKEVMLAASVMIFGERKRRLGTLWHQ